MFIFLQSIVTKVQQSVIPKVNLGQTVKFPQLLISKKSDFFFFKLKTTLYDKHHEGNAVPKMG